MVMICRIGLHWKNEENPLLGIVAENSSDFFNKLGSDGESCSNPEAIAQNIGISLPSSENSDISNIA